RGVNPEPLLKKLAPLRGHVDAINLTDNALGKVKMSGLVFGAMIKSRLGIPVVLNFSCRDRNLLALKSDLLGAGALGIDAVVALTGDKLMLAGDAHAVRELNAFGLLRVIGALNRGDTGEGKPALKTVARLVAGAVANPNRRDLNREFDLIRRKAEAGAKFLITQPVFDAADARAFIRRAGEHGLKVVLGILPIKRAAMAHYMRDRVNDLSDVRGHLERYTGLSEEQARRQSLEENLALMRALACDAAGFNIMSGGGPSLAIELALEFSRWRAQPGA
ncbi:MAG: methylenetetrahydrofolate reductase, partial [Candidatus Binataceae bacterium]